MLFLGDEERGERAARGAGGESCGMKTGVHERGRERMEALAQGSAQMGRRGQGLGARRPRGGAGVSGRENGRKSTVGGEPLQGLCWDHLRDATSLLGRGEKQPHEGQWLPSATWKQRSSAGCPGERWKVVRGGAEEPVKGHLGERKGEGQGTGGRVGRRPLSWPNPTSVHLSHAGRPKDRLLLGFH